MTTVN